MRAAPARSGLRALPCSGVLRMRAVFPRHGCSKKVLQMRVNSTWRSQTAATALQILVAAPVRARKQDSNLKSQVCTTKRGAQFTARPTLTLRSRSLRGTIGGDGFDGVSTEQLLWRRSVNAVRFSLNMGPARRSRKCERAKLSGHRPPLQNCR